MSRYGRYYGGWAPYVPVAQRRRQAEAEAVALNKKGKKVDPVRLEGGKIASTFWGKAWCGNLEAYSDYSNRLPRGRSYVRNGAVLDLKISEGRVDALVRGSRLYKIQVKIKPLEEVRWQAIVTQCSGKIDSLVELLQGKFSSAVMEFVTHKQRGLFPAPKQIAFDCSCPDYASLCKHVGATLYGVGARLDLRPELLFLLRKVDHNDLLARAGEAARFKKASTGRGGKKSQSLPESDLSKIFGIDLDAGSARPKRGKPA